MGCAMNVVHWATEQAVEQLRISQENPDFNCTIIPMHLWKSFQVAFPKDTTPGDYEVYIMLYCSVYSEVVRALIAR